MTARWLILADDLTGAADCAIAFVRHGLDAVVSWGDGAGCAATVLAIDAGSRHFFAPAAAACQVAAQAAHWQPGTRLYKKIDSTLRGNPAAELAGQLAALESATGRRAPLAVMAPAFPATGRTTVDGRVLLDGLPLEQSGLWGREHSYASAALPEILTSAGLAADVIGLDTVRSGGDEVLGRMRDAERQGVAAVVCDSTTEADLAVVAEASLGLTEAVWVGSAGLAAALAAALSPGAPLPAPTILRRGPVLIVVGSLAETSRLQARMLAQSGGVKHLVVTPKILLAGPRMPGWPDAAGTLADSLAAKADVLLEIGPSASPDLARGGEVAAGLAEMVAEAAPRIGAMVATGGQIAYAVLSRLDVRGIRLVDEVEPGVPLGTNSWRAVDSGRHQGGRVRRRRHALPLPRAAQILLISAKERTGCGHITKQLISCDIFAQILR